METIFACVSVALFTGLIVLFLQRSSEAEPRDHLWQYLAASGGCAVANYLGNEGYQVWAGLTIVFVLVFIWIVLRPYEGWKKD